MQSGARVSLTGGWSLCGVSDGALEAELFRLLRANARTEAWVVAHLAEVEVRRLHLRAGYDSMFQYCLVHLRLGDFEAFLRITAARMVAKFPVVLDLLERQDIHLTAIRLLRDHLTDENHLELLNEAKGKSKRQLETLLARRFPRPDVPERLRKLPVLEPLSPGRYRLELTIDEELKDKLELARDLLSHANPTHDLAMVIARGTDALLSQLQRRRFGKTKRREGTVEKPAAAARRAELKPGRAQATPNGASGDSAARSSAVARPPVANDARGWVPNELRRRIVDRDGLRCAYTSPDGRRCTSRAFLEIHHVEPWAKGGAETYENLRVFCARHNRWQAEQDFGPARVARAVTTRGGGTLPGQPGQRKTKRT